ncbi:hypothetical protein TGARI_370150, partial [Toxoplasma gondii ARI]
LEGSPPPLTCFFVIFRLAVFFPFFAVVSFRRRQTDAWRRCGNSSLTETFSRRRPCRPDSQDSKGPAMDRKRGTPPALYHEFLGRYTSMPHATHASSPSSSPVSSSSSTSFLRPFRAPGGSASTQLPAASSPQEPQQNEGKDFFSAHPRSLSSCLLSAMDSRMLRRQVQEERDRWRRQDEELLANIDGGRALKTLREEREARRLQRFLQREEHRERREDEEEESEGIDSDLETEEDEESTDNVNGDHPGVAPAGGKRRRRFVDATTYAQKQDDFLLLMQENFLAGRDAHYIDYKSIDQDEALDDLQEVDRDAEEKYFCGEDEPTETDAEKRPPA